jgi:hypothetical protein
MFLFTGSWPCAVTTSYHGIAIGYYVDCDDAVCRDCAPAGFDNGDYSQWPGFEGWEEPIAIFMDAEADTPTHCTECGAVIAHDLTPDGESHVLEAIADLAGDPGSHSAEVVAQWWDAYSGHMYPGSLLRDWIAEHTLARAGAGRLT